MFKPIMLLFVTACTSLVIIDKPLTQVHEVTIGGYQGIAMEPFISRDGSYLLFNNSNDPASNTDIFYALRKNDFSYDYVGPLGGINTPSLEGTPTMDLQGKIFFVSTRSYAATACTIYSGQFNQGNVSQVQVVDSICRHEPGIVNFDVDIDPAGTLMTFVDSQFGANQQPQTAKLVMAQSSGTQFVRLANSDAILKTVNAGVLQYAPALSADRLTLWFTRLAALSGTDFPQIWQAKRSTPSEPFGVPVRLEGLGDFVEAPALSADEKLLYFHRRVGSGYRIFAVSVK